MQNQDKPYIDPRDHFVFTNDPNYPDPHLSEEELDKILISRAFQAAKENDPDWQKNGTHINFKDHYTREDYAALLGPNYLLWEKLHPLPYQDILLNEYLSKSIGQSLLHDKFFAERARIAAKKSLREQIIGAIIAFLLVSAMLFLPAYL